MSVAIAGKMDEAKDAALALLAFPARRLTLAHQSRLEIAGTGGRKASSEPPIFRLRTTLSRIP